MIHNVWLDSSKRGLTLGVGIWIFKISSMSSVLFFVLDKVYEIAMVFFFFMFLGYVSGYG